MNPALHHVHVYFDDAREDAAWRIRTQASAHPQVMSVGRFHNAPVGPHPVRQFQLLVSAENLDDVIEWLDGVRAGFDVLIHPEIEDDLLAHTKLARWLGHAHTLNLDIFR